MLYLSIFVCPFICKGWGNKRKLLDKKPTGTLQMSNKWQKTQGHTHTCVYFVLWLPVLKIKIFVDSSEWNFHKVRALTFCCGRCTSKAKL